MPDRSNLHLIVIVETIQVIRSYLGDVDKQNFLNDPILCDAVALRLQVIGEAARRVVPEERQEAPEIAWADIVAFRHREASTSALFGILRRVS